MSDSVTPPVVGGKPPAATPPTVSGAAPTSLNSVLGSSASLPDGRYYPTKFSIHPFTLDGFKDSLKTGDAVYIAHNGDKFFVVSPHQGMAFGTSSFPEPANLLEVVK